eukprot:maker-scaffold_12-snap-gene-3.14-mRNA-1 protein AED:0.02 eAED:0.08 QI:0/0/0.33/0.66/0/0.33/3/384/259
MIFCEVIQVKSNLSGTLPLANQTKPMSLLDASSDDDIDFLPSSVHLEEPSGNSSFITNSPQKPIPEKSNSRLVNLLQSSTHPTISFFHLIFKACACFIYLSPSILSTFFTIDFIQWFLPCLLSMCCDFWVSKNISGRKLVKLRYWNDIDEQGKNVWRFEHHNTESVNSIDKTIFWYAMYLNMFFWCFFFVWNILGFKFSNLVIIIIAIILQGTNLWGFWKCSKEQQSQVEGLGKEISSRWEKFVQNSAIDMVKNKISRT